MNSRQKEILQAQLDSEKAVLKQLEGNYQDALDEINSKIELLMARQDADMQHVIYQVEYQKALKTQVQAILETLQANEFETVSEYLANSYHEGFIGTMYDLQGQGIPLIFPIDQEQVVAAVQTETKLSENLYTAMGKDIKTLQKQIAGGISRGLSSGQMYSEITRNIAGYARISKNRAMTIARTEAHRIQTKATSDAQHRAKEKGADVVKQWDASLDRKTRDSHRKVDGEIRELDEPFSNGLMYPGDPDGGAAEVINCRCALLQRARWALGNDFTKWSPDAEIEISDEGTTQFLKVDAKSYKEFKGYYQDITGQMTMNLTNRNSSRVRSSVQKIKDKEVLEDNGKLSYNSGAVSGAYNNHNDPKGEKRDKHAETYYNSMKNSKKEPIVEVIARNAQIDAESVSKMYDHLMVNKYDLEKGYTTFEPDYYISESLRRLREGKNIQAHDLILIRHEAMEYDLMNNSGMNYKEAHDITNKSYNYEEALDKWLDENE